MDGKAETHSLKLISPLWSLAGLVLMPVVFPPILICYAGIVFGPFYVKVIFLLAVMNLWYAMDRDTRGRVNDNVRRVRSALAARAAAATGREPVALLLHSFTNQTAYRDEEFALYERVDPALRSLEFRPLAFGTALPLAPDHGVALITTSDDRWWDAFRTAARHAAVIFVSPERTESLGREISWLATERLTGKLVVLMAPEPLEIMRETGDPNTDYIDSAGPKDARIESWSEARRVWREELNLELPAYDPRGAVITFREIENGAWSRPLRKFARENFFSRGNRLVKGTITGDYNTGAGIDLSSPLREAFMQRGWTGPPVSELWLTLSPPALEIGPRPRFHPPGSSGREVGNICMTLALIGWSSTLIVSCLVGS